MPPVSTPASTPATDGAWMDVVSAALYAGVTRAELASALQRGELSAAARYGPMLVHSHDVETWAASREARPVAYAS
jgi:hypothetical protein